MSDFDESYRLIYADEPGHIRLAGDPWAGIAKVVEQAMAVLEDGQRKLAEVWHSPGGTAYLAEMARVVAAMQATSDAARHNDQVMSAAADVLDGKQKDFAILSTAPIPADARERYARAIVNSLDEDYQQAVANFRPVPSPREDIDEDRPLAADGSGNTTRLEAAGSGGASGPGGGSARKAGTPKQLPPWVPEQPAGQSVDGSPATIGPASSKGGVPSGGPELQGMAGGGAYLGSGTSPGGGPSSSPAFQPSLGPPGAGRGGLGPVAPPLQTPPALPSPRSPARSRVPSTPYPEGEPLSGRQASAAMRVGASGQPGAMVGGVPTGGTPASGGQRPWQGYRRAPEPFPTSRRIAVAPIIGSASIAEPEPDQVSTDYEDEDGNQITIRRARD